MSYIHFFFNIVDLILFRQREKRNFTFICHFLFFFLYVRTYFQSRPKGFCYFCSVFFLYANRKRKGRKNTMSKRRRKKKSWISNQSKIVNQYNYVQHKNKWKVRNLCFSFEVIIKFAISRFSFNKCRKFYQNISLNFSKKDSLFYTFNWYFSISISINFCNHLTNLNIHTSNWKNKT